MLIYITLNHFDLTKKFCKARNICLLSESESSWLPNKSTFKDGWYIDVTLLTSSYIVYKTLKSAEYLQMLYKRTHRTVDNIF